MYDITASIVLFKNDADGLRKCIGSFLNTDMNTYLYIIDNSPTDNLRQICSFKNAQYIFNNANLGFGAGHNIALRRMTGRTKYSLILNPDVYFNKGTLEKLFNFMEEDKGVGLVMPKVLYSDGSLQYLCKLLPNPYDMLIKKINFGILKPLFDLQRARNELRFADYDKIMDVPYLSGCFMFIRTNIFEKTGLFDERFFIHFEDLDLTRRIHKLYRTVYYPEAFVYHKYERNSNKDVKIFKYLVSSGIKYFNKWGWFFDKERKIINKKVIKTWVVKKGVKS